MTKTQQLRALPSVDELLKSDSLSSLHDRFPRPQIVGWVRQAIDQARQNVLDGKDASVQEITSNVCDLAESDFGKSIRKVINATGILLHTNLGRAPMATEAIERMQQATAYANVELDLNSGKRSRRGDRAMRLIAELTGAEDAIVVNNCAAATMLVLQAIAGGREVIVSRGQLVEIGGGFRLPDVFKAAGVELKEIGTTNRTYVRDYEGAVGDNTGAIIRVHRSNFAQHGFVTEPSIEELVVAKRPENIPVIDDLGSGCIHDLSKYGFNEPVVAQSVACGADLSLFSGDKLFGGPQCGIVIGRKHWIQQLRSHPMMRAMRVDKLTLTAMEATAEIHLSDNAFEKIPVLRMIAKSPESIRGQCETVVKELGGPGASVAAVPCESQIGGGSIPGSALQSFAVEISGCKIEALAKRLRLGIPAVQGRVARDSMLFDLRTVEQDQLPLLITQLKAAVGDQSP